MNIENISKIYASLIQRGVKTLDDVPDIPENLKKEVKVLLDTDE